MAGVGEAVDDGHRGVLGHFQQAFMGVGAHHDGIDVAAENLRGIGDGLAAAQLHVGRGEVDHVAAELAHPDLEADAGAGGGFFEDHRQHPAGERFFSRAAGFQRALVAGGGVEHVAQRRAVMVADVDEVPGEVAGGLRAPALR